MSAHNVTLSWSREGKPFGYKEYSRDHDLDFGHGVTLRASAAAEFLGTAEIPDPEQAYKWYRVAAAAGNEEAVARLQRLRERVEQSAADGNGAARRLMLQWQ